MLGYVNLGAPSCNNTTRSCSIDRKDEGKKYFCAVLQLQERYARKNEAADLRRAFDLLDIKNDGHIDAEELAETFSRLRHKIKKARALLRNSLFRNCIRSSTRDKG
jgi:Ca2+-binding EF-hand superfamily protein